LQVVAEQLHQLDPLGTEKNFVYILSDGAELSEATATVTASDAGFDNRLGVIGPAAGDTLGRQPGAVATYGYATDNAADNYFALVNSDAAGQRVRYYAVLADGTEHLVHDGLPAEFTFSDAMSKSAELAATSLLLKFEDSGDNDYNDLIVRVTFDGRPSAVNTADERATLESLGAQISAVGMGANADLAALDPIDNTLGAEVSTSADGLDVSLVGLPFQPAEVDHIVLFVNAKALTYDAEDLTASGGSLTLKVAAEDLNRVSGETNDITVEVTLNTGIALTARLAIEGALPRSTDFVL
jgi:hypothetical protein